MKKGGESWENGNRAVQEQIPIDFNVMSRVESNFCKQFKDNGFTKKKPGQGGPRATKANDDRYLLIIARFNSFSAVS